MICVVVCPWEAKFTNGVASYVNGLLKHLRSLKLPVTYLSNEGKLSRSEKRRARRLTTRK